MRIASPLPNFGGWPVTPARYLFERQQRLAWESDEIVTAFRDGVVTLRSNRRIEGFTNAIQEFGYQGVRPGDLVIHSMDGFAGAIGVSDSTGKASPVVHVYQARNGADPRFFAYTLRVLAAQGFVAALAKGIRERSTAFDSEVFRSLVFTVPSSSTQTAIANFLDTESARIEAVIAKKRRLEFLVVARFRTLVDNVVAKGSAVEARRVTSLITSGPRGWSGMVGDEGAPFIRSANLRRDDLTLQTDNLQRVNVVRTPESTRSKVEDGDVVIGITGANTGWVGVVRGDLSAGYVSQHVAIMRPNGVLPEWLAFSLFGSTVQGPLLANQYGGTKQQVGLDDLAGIRLFVPSLKEQRELVDRLVESDQNRRSLTARLSEQVELLREHRQALITAAVTGQVDIPGMSAA